MSARFVQDGELLDYSQGTAIAAAVPVVLGARVFVTTRALAANELGSVATRGVFMLTKHTSENTDEQWAMGDKLYWDATNTRVTKVASTHKVIGYAAAAADKAATLGPVLLGQ